MFNPFQELSPVVWLYVAGVVVVACFWRFRGMVAVRNWDLLTLLAAGPAMVWVTVGHRPALGFLVLLGVTGYFMLRTVVDLTLRSRPACEPNLSAGGLAFLLLVLCAYQVGLIFERPVHASAAEGARGGWHLLHYRQMVYDDVAAGPYAERFGPGYYLWHVPAAAIANQLFQSDRADQTLYEGRRQARDLAARAVVALAHLLTIAGLAVVGIRLLGGTQAALALAVLYAVLPYTMHAMHMTHHVLLGMVLVWALACCTGAFLSGAILGLAVLVNWQMVLLVPLWAGFHRQRGLSAFAVALGLMLLVGLAPTLVTGGNILKLLEQSVLHSADGGLASFAPGASAGEGFWKYHASPSLRLPAGIALAVAAVLLFFWPKAQSPTRLAALSAVLLLGLQFCLPAGGGTYILWYMPFLLVVVLRGGGEGAGPEH